MPPVQADHSSRRRNASIGRPLIAVADAGWHTTDHLFRAIDPERAETLLLECVSFANARSRGIPLRNWVDPTREISPGLHRRRLVLPPGWMSIYPALGMRPLSATIARRRRAAGGPLVLVFTYPQYLTLADRLKPEVCIYFNVDDYRLYWPKRSAEVEAMEIESVRRADLTFCVSLHRAEELRRSVPEAAERIRHLPHGVPRDWLAPEAIAGPAPAPDRIARLPRPLIGYIGSLEDRVDWALLDRIAEAFGEASLVLVGDHSPMQPGGETPRDRCLARPNVHAIGRCEQSEVPAFNRSFDVALIPYLVEHPFNIACCPTKIMDTFAAARPLVSTALPECLLHRERMTIADDDAGFVEAIGRILAAGSTDGLESARFDWAAGHTCDLVVSELLDAAEAILAGRSPRASR